MRIVGFLILLSLAFFTVKGQSINAASQKKLEEYLQASSRTKNFSGSVIVAKDEKIMLKKGYGMANYEYNIPNTPITKFRIGSLTKAFTAVMILQLVEAGKIKLNGKITNYLPKYPNKNGDTITIHQLLSHTSGLPHYEAIPDFLKDMVVSILQSKNLSISFQDYPFYPDPEANIDIAVLGTLF